VTLLKFIVLFLALLVALVLCLLMLPFVAYWGLGLAVPAIVVVGMPLRVIYVLIKGQYLFKVLFLALLAPWAIYLYQVAVSGWISRSANETGPTVNPVIWACIGIAWIAVEALRYLARLKADAAAANAAAWERIRGGA